MQHGISLIKNRYTYRTIMTVGVVIFVALAADVVTRVVKKGQELCMKKKQQIIIEKIVILNNKYYSHFKDHIGK